MKPITLAEHETIIAAVPNYAGGPGWSNTPIWVWVYDWQAHTARQECIQPEDQTSEMHALFPVAAAAHEAMLKTVPTKKAKRAKP
jgi:hypothetical protein